MEDSNCASSIMAKLSLSALEKSCKDESSWLEPSTYRAILVSGLSVLIASMKLLENDLGGIDCVS